MYQILDQFNFTSTLLPAEKTHFKKAQSLCIAWRWGLFLLDCIVVGANINKDIHIGLICIGNLAPSQL